MALTLVITNAGRAALRNADASGTRAVRIAAVGFSAAALAATAATAALPGEIKRVTTVSGDAVAADIIHLVVQDETMAVYTVRSFALYLDDGTLFAAYGQADPIIEKSAQAVLLLALDVTLADIAAAQITFGNANFLLPPATTDRAGLVELATDAEALALTDAVRALTPRNMAAIFTAANVLARLIQVDGAGSGLDADLLDGRQASEFALLTGATFTGGIAAPFFQAFGPGIGSVSVLPGNATTNGFISFRNSNNVQSGVIGSHTFGSSILYSCAAGHYFDSNVGIQGGLNVVGGISSNGSAVWHVGNDGAGSGLDADMLDGQHGSWYADIVARLGYTPVNAVSYNGYEILAKLMGNDGAGSGLDADLLDGRQASEFALLTGANFTGGIAAPFFQAFGPGIGSVSVLPGNATTNGFISFRNSNNVQSGIIGSHTFGSSILYSCAAGHYFDSSVGIQGGLNVVGGISSNGSAVWHVGNDGAGSGLDADMLDGQHGSWYADIVARLGFTPVNAVSYNGYEILAKLMNNDGAGSGLDADLLDGQDGEWYRRWANLTGVPGAFPPTGHSHGAADLAGAFAGSLAENGYTVLPNGLILQWMTGPMQAARTSATTYMQWPIAFPTACFQAFASTQMQQAGDRGDSWFQLVGSPDRNGATIQRQASGTADDIVASAPRLFAIGM